MIHHTRGVYPNGEYKDNGVPTEYLDEHVEYNKAFRPGRALFVDGHCVYEGFGVSAETLAKHEGAARTMTRDTAPYH